MPFFSTFTGSLSPLGTNTVIENSGGGGGAGGLNGDGDDSPEVTWGNTLNVLYTFDSPIGRGANNFFGLRLAVDSTNAIIGAETATVNGETYSGFVAVYDLTDGSRRSVIENPNAFGDGGGDRFGQAVDISGDYFIVGTRSEEDAGGNFSGKAWIYRVSDGSLVHTLDNPNLYGTSASDLFGIDVAIHNNYAVVGASGEEDPDDGVTTNSGAVHVYNVITGEKRFSITNPNPSGAVRDRFGRSVDINESYLVVGADNAPDQPDDVGQIFVYDLSGTLLRTIDNPLTGIRFGGTQSISISGDKMLVGAPYTDTDGIYRAGAAHIFDLTDGSLLRTIKRPSGNVEESFFGEYVDLHGNYAVIGSNAGAFGIQQLGVTDNFSIYDIRDGSVVGTITDTDTDGDGDGVFGLAVAIDGEYIVTANYSFDHATDIDIGGGRAYVYKGTRQ